MKKNERKKFDNLRLGFAVGFLAPLIVFFAVYSVNYFEIVFIDFIRMLLDKQLFTKIISLCALPNLILFFVFLNTSRYRTTQGIIAAPFVNAFVMMFIKFSL